MAQEPKGSLSDPQCPACTYGRGDEVDFSLSGSILYQCDECGALFTHDSKGLPVLLQKG